MERSDLAEFEKVARRDRHKRRGSQGSAGGPIARENVEISYEMWSVLQIDSHSDQLGKPRFTCLDIFSYFAQTIPEHGLTSSRHR